MTASPFRHRARLATATLAVVALGLAGCGGDDDDSTESSGGNETTTTEAASPTSEAGIEVSGVWARSTAPGQEAGAAYLEVTAEEDDAIVGASVPSEIAGVVELHETVAAEESAGMDQGSMGEEDGAMDEGAMGEGDDTTTTAAEGDDGGMDDGGMDDGGMDGGGMEGDMGSMTMVPVESIELPAGETVALEPGGLHIMLLELGGPLEAGDSFPLTLTFESGAEIEVDVQVADQAP